MIIKMTKYAIATKTFPLMFTDESGEFYDSIDEIVLNDSEEYTMDLISEFDEPENLQAAKINVTYEI